MKECITTVSTNVLVNGSLSGELELRRGIRQGNPLSPFLFLTKRAIREGLLVPARVGKDKVEISHVQYADDTVFVVEGDLDNAAALKRLLLNYEWLSGLSVNFDKSCVFGYNLEQGLVEEIAGVLGCRVGSGTIPYLGLKIGGRLNGREAWSDMVEKIESKLKRWDSRHISMGGKSTLVKSTLSAVPIYWLSFFPLPRKTEERIRSL